MFGPLCMETVYQTHQPFKPLSIMPAASLHACFPWAKTPTVLYFTTIWVQCPYGTEGKQDPNTRWSEQTVSAWEQTHLCFSQRVNLTLSQRFIAARCLFFLAGCPVNFRAQGVISLVGTDAAEGPDLPTQASEPDLLWHPGPRQISSSWHRF